jgi:glycerophosphoryl diester phosphodiesterase
MIRVIGVWMICIATLTAHAQGKGTVLVCGHRGGFYNMLPENSFAAIRYTAENCKPNRVVIEVDVRRSKDGTLYILHDETVDRTTNGRGNIAALADNYIHALKLKTSSGMLTDESLPTFREVLIYAKSNNVILMLDVKDDIWNDVINLVNKYSMEERCIALTFNPAVTAKVYNLSKTIAISFLAKDIASWDAIQKLNIPGDNLVAYVSSATDSLLKEVIGQRKIITTGDASESVRNNSSLYSREFYRATVGGMSLDILITDFPVDVLRLLQQE